MPEPERYIERVLHGKCSILLYTEIDPTILLFTVVIRLAQVYICILHSNIYNATLLSIWASHRCTVLCGSSRIASKLVDHKSPFYCLRPMLKNNNPITIYTLFVLGNRLRAEYILLFLLLFDSLNDAPSTNIIKKKSQRMWWVKHEWVFFSSLCFICCTHSFAAISQYTNAFVADGRSSDS